ncbi:MAG: hypothetical protein AB2L24_21930 [Mangrovibacterium sp.]
MYFNQAEMPDDDEGNPGGFEADFVPQFWQDDVVSAADLDPELFRPRLQVLGYDETEIDEILQQ